MNEQKTAEELSTLSSSELLFKLDELREMAREAGYAAAEADKHYKDLKELMPSFLAQYVSHHSGPGINVTQSRNRALADKGYMDKIKEMNIAEYEARLAEVQYKGWMESIKALTAIAYVRNQEMKL